MPTPPPLLTVLPLTSTEMWSPVSTANVTLFRPSTFFIIAQTQLGLQLDIQLVPIMQVFVRLEPQIRGQTCGKRVTTWHPSPPPAAGHAGASHCPPPQACVGTSTRTKPTTSGPSAACWRAQPLLSPTPGRPRLPAPTSRTALRTPAPSAWRTVCVQRPWGLPGAGQPQTAHTRRCSTRRDSGCKEAAHLEGSPTWRDCPAPLTRPPPSTEKFAQHWCSRLTDTQGPFAQCHSTVDPSAYYSVMPPPGSAPGPGPPSGSQGPGKQHLGQAGLPGSVPASTHSLTHSLTHSVIHKLTHSLTHSFSHSQTHSFIHSLVHSFIHSFSHSFIHSLIQSLSHLFTHSFTHLFIHSRIHSLTHLFTHSFTYLFIHSLIHLLTHSLTHSVINYSVDHSLTHPL